MSHHSRSVPVGPELAAHDGAVRPPEPVEDSERLGGVDPEPGGGLAGEEQAA